MLHCFFALHWQINARIIAINQAISIQSSTISRTSHKKSQNLDDSPPPSILEAKNYDSSQDLSANPTPQESSYFAKNPAFNDKQNAIRLEFGASVRSQGFENLYQVQFIYSQPNRFFRIHGRLNVEVGGFFGFGRGFGGMKLNTLNLGFAGVSWDILLPLFISKSSGNLYAGVGIGGYIKTKGESRVISNFTFGERVFVGYLWRNFSFEMFIKHFSNGTLSVPNSGHNFFGITSGYVF